MDNKKLCQSCAMPMENNEYFGNNTNGSKNEDYCQYCYKDGAFTKEESMAGMIEICIPHTVDAGVYKDADEARTTMQSFFPKLKRWSKA